MGAGINLLLKNKKLVNQKKIDLTNNQNLSLGHVNIIDKLFEKSEREKSKHANKKQKQCEKLKKKNVF